MRSPPDVMWHNPKVAQAALEIGAKVAEWDAVDENLKSLAHMAVAAQVGCMQLVPRHQLLPGAEPEPRHGLDTAPTFGSRAGRISRIYAMRNPHKLGRLEQVAEPRR